MSDKRIYELLNSNTLSAGDKLAIDKNSFSEAKSIDASLILTPISDLESEKVPKSDLTNISITGTKNNTGSTITSGTFFYKDGTLVKAKTDIANNATLTLNTNYEIVTAGGLNALNEALSLLNHTTNDTIIGKDENGKDIHRKIYTGTSFTNGMVIDANLKKANLDWVSIESFTYSISTTMYGNQTDTGENTRYLASVMFNSSGMVAMNSNIAVTKYRIVVHYVLAWYIKWYLADLPWVGKNSYTDATSRGWNMLEDFIKYAKEEYGIIITVKESNNPDTFEKIFGGSFTK